MTERREAAVVDSAANQLPLHEHVSAHALVERQALRTPDHTAACTATEALSYRELDRRANLLAHVLATHGVGIGSRVGILLRHSVETVVAIVGVLKTGAAYLPLDPDFPVARLRRTLDHADVRLVVTTSDLAPVAGGGRSTLSVDADAALLANAPDTRPDVQTAPEDPAYVIYTSGSTGAPKGIVIPHRALVNYVVWANAEYLDHTALNFALHSSLAFDLTVTSIFSPITTGGTVVAYPALQGAPPIVDVLREDRVDIVKLTPSHLAFVGEQSTIPARLRTFIVGGENLDTALARRVHEKFRGRVAIFNEYGPTETTVGCMIHRYDPERDRRASVPIGRAAANTRILLLDDRRAPVAPEVAGELYVGGAGLATGYLGDQGLTDERFVDDPFEPGARLYRTGDFAQSFPDGAIEFLGRNDDQIKMRGHRIRLSEVRHVITQHPAVRDCVVRHFEDRDAAKVLVAYCVADAAIDATALRAFSREHLVQAAVPSAFVFLEQLPLTLNGKVDVRALPGLDEVRRQSDHSDRPPRTATEKTLAEIWCRLLRYERVGIDESFFDLGGDSLMAIHLFLEIEDAFGIRFPTSVLFSDATIERVAQAIEGRQTTRSGAHLVHIRPHGSRPPLFLFHGIGGDAVVFGPFVRHLPSTQPVYGLQGDGINLQRGSTLAIETMASGYLEAIREVQPTGPYFLAGYSAGGITAYETARQIRAAGGEVGLLAIIDGDAPPSVRGTWRWTPGTLGRFAVNLARWTTDDLLRSSAADVGARVQSKLRLLRSRLMARRSASPQGGGSDIRDTAGVPQLPERYIPWLEAYVGAIDKYRPRPYPGRIVLLRASVFGLFQQVVPDRGWTALTEDLSIRIVKGNHTSIMQEPLVSRLAEELERFLSGDVAT